MISAISHSDHYSHEMKLTRQGTSTTNNTTTPNTEPTSIKSSISALSPSTMNSPLQSSPLMCSPPLVLSTNKSQLGHSDPPSSFGTGFPISASKMPYSTILTKTEEATPTTNTVPLPALESGKNPDSIPVTSENTSHNASLESSSSPTKALFTSHNSSQPGSSRRAFLVPNHHQITLDQDRTSGKMLSDDDSSSSYLSDQMSRYKNTDTNSSLISSIHEDSEPIESSNTSSINDKIDNSSELSAHTFRPTSSVPSMSLLYSDTAPRATWRPQLESWLKKHHPSQLREVQRAPSPPPLLDSLVSHWSFTALTAKHSAQMHELKRHSRRRRALSHSISSSFSDIGGSDMTDPNEFAIDDKVPASQPTKKHSHPNLRKSSSNSGLRSPRKKSYGSREMKPYSRTSPTMQNSQISHSSQNQAHRPRSNSSNQNQLIHGPVLTISPAEQNFTVQPVPSSTGQVPLPSASGSTQITPNNSSLHPSYHPPSPPSSPGNTASNNKASLASSRNLPTIPAHAGQTMTFHSKRRCISCGSDQSPCWRPSWSPSAGQLCNSCGLRYKKTNARCLTKGCGRIPAKGEWVSMKNAAIKNPSTGSFEYKCLYCNGAVEVGDKH